MRMSVKVAAMVIALAPPVLSHFDHGVGGERLLFEAPPPIDRLSSRGGLIRFGPTPVVHVPFVPTMNTPDGFTIAAWVWLDSAYVGTSPGVVAGRWHQIQGEASFVLRSAGSGDGGLRVAWSDGSESGLWGYELPTLRWFHYAASVSDSSMAVFVDGERVAQTRVSKRGIAESLSPFWIGGSTEGVTFPGMIADVLLTSRAMSEDEIGRVLNGHADPHPIGRWLVDSLTDGGAERAGSVRWVDDPVRGAVADFRTPHQIELPHDDWGIEGEITVAAWALNRGVARGGGAIISHWGPRVDERSFVLYSVGIDGFGFRAFWGDGSQSNLTEFDVPANRWFHLAGTYDGRAMRLYVDGVEAARAVAVNRIFAKAIGPVVIGGNGDPAAPPFSGALDEVGVWRAALSVEEIGILAATGTPPRASELCRFETFGPGDDTAHSSEPSFTFLEASAANDTAQLSTYFDESGNLRAAAGDRRPEQLTFPAIPSQRLLDEALWWAVLREQFGAARELLARGGNINALIGGGGSSLLHEAVAGGRFESIQFLIQHGGDTTLRDLTHRSSPWEWATRLEMPVLRAYLLDVASVTSLDAAVENGHFQRAESIVADRVVSQDELNRALGRAATGGHLEIADYLIRSGADVFRDSMGLLPVDRAVRSNQYELVDFLREKAGFPSTVPFREQVDRLDSAIEAKDVLQAAALLNVEPDLVHCDSERGRTWLQRAGDVDDGDLTRLLLERGASLDREREGHSAVSWAISRGSSVAAQALLEAGAEIDLWTAAGLGLVDALETYWVNASLVEGASVRGSFRRGPDGAILPRPPVSEEEVLSDALYIGARNGHVDVVKWLLSRGANPNFRAERGGTPLYWATKQAHLDVVRALVVAGADPRVPDRYGRSAVQMAAGSRELIQALTGK